MFALFMVKNITKFLLEKHSIFDSKKDNKNNNSCQHKLDEK